MLHFLFLNEGVSMQYFNTDEYIPKREYAKSQRKSLRLKILVFENDVQIREHDVDFSKKENRLWVCNLIVWACCNHKYVKISRYE